MSRSSPSQIHELKTVYIDFKITLDLIKSGYHFDDENAGALLEQLERALGILQTEISLMEKNNRS
jgi:hypothetical protein